MDNRRFGGGPPQKGGRSLQHFQSVNPWQGGIAPNNPVNSGMLSLSTSQQLALALSLLQNQSQQPQMNNPPSLLSLNTAPSFERDNYGPPNRFGNRGGRDFRRPEPYNKNRGGPWRSDNNANRGYGNRIGNNSSGRSGPRVARDRKSPSKNKPSNKVSKASDKKDKVTVDSKKDKDDTVDLSVDETREEDASEGGKRDWKQEKNKSDDKDKDDSDAVDLTEEGAEEKRPKDGLKRPREGIYYDVPPSLLHCFVCNKSMWDGESFQNHVRGKAHKQMMDSLEESFQISVNILRENMRLTEEKKLIELERKNRSSRFHRNRESELTSHCNMCDLKFLGKIIQHRKTQGHQRLKRFLHPNCNQCNLEFPSRMEWVEHRFTPDHLRKIKELMDNATGGQNGVIMEDDLEMDNEPLLDESLQNEHENPVLELSDDLQNLQNRIPVYKTSRAIGREGLKPITGFFCEYCDRVVTSEAKSETHLKSEKHYNKFVEAVKRKYKKVTEQKAREEEEVKRKKRKLDADAAKEAKTKTTEGEDSKPDATANGDDLYNPEEASCDDDVPMEDPSAINFDKQLKCEDEENWAAIDEEIKIKEEALKTEPESEVKEEEVAEEEDEAAPEVETKATAPSASPRTRQRGGAVKNGAGPRSKTTRAAAAKK